jgi:hypothetical protein
LLDRDVGGARLSLEVDVSSLFGLSYRCRGVSVLQATLCSCSSSLVFQFLVAHTCEGICGCGFRTLLWIRAGIDDVLRLRVEGK